MIDAVITYEGEKFRRYSATDTVTGLNRIIWAVSRESALRLAQNYSGAERDDITIDRAPLFLCLDKVSNKALKEAA